MDKIEIEAIDVFCIIGVRDRERIEKQRILISLQIYCDLRQAGQSDRIADTIDYSRLKNKVAEFVEQSDFFLVEKLATEVAKLILQLNTVNEVKVRIEKPDALSGAKTVAVEISRTKGSFLENGHLGFSA